MGEIKQLFPAPVNVCHLIPLLFPMLEPAPLQLRGQERGLVQKPLLECMWEWSCVQRRGPQRLCPRQRPSPRSASPITGKHGARRDLLTFLIVKVILYETISLVATSDSRVLPSHCAPPRRAWTLPGFFLGCVGTVRTRPDNGLHLW